MQDDVAIQKMVRARTAGVRKLNHLTAGVAISAFAGVGLIGALGALTIPGTSSSHGLATCVPTITTPTTTESDETNSDDSASPSSTGLAPSCTVNSSTSTGVAVSGGSHPH